MATMFKLLAAAVATIAVGCSGHDHVDSTESCAADPRGEAFVLGMTKAGKNGSLSFSLVGAQPNELIRGDNAWELDIKQGEAAVTGAAITVKPFMPDHRHGTSIDVVVTPSATIPGRYSLAPVNLWMPGIWEVTVTAAPAGGAQDIVIFSFCIEG